MYICVYCFNVFYILIIKGRYVKILWRMGFGHIDRLTYEYVKQLSEDYWFDVTISYYAFA